jgi:tetraacyldisaccharide 4'-kinase
MVVRNWLFDMGFLRATQVDVPVISVGNLDAGGAGKTPLVEFLARTLAAKGRKVAIVSRGYGRTTSGMVVVSNGFVICAEASASGDEPAQMAAKLSGVRVVVDEVRSRGAQYAVSKLGADVIVLDDGFQHRYLRRNVDIVVIPADRAVDPGWMLPAGNRREPLSSLERATLVAVSRCASVDQFQAAKRAVGTWSKKPIIGLSTKVSAVRRATTRFSVDLAGLKGKSAIAFSGIGDPASFEKTVSTLGVQLKSHNVFPDHHEFGISELRSLEDSLKVQSADFLLTTEKDVVRLSSADSEGKRFLERTPSFYVEIEQHILDGEALLNEALAIL